MPSFHEVLFPIDVARGAAGGPERVTEVVTTVSGREERNTRRADSRRRWDAGYGVKSLAALHTVLAFFEERRGRLHGFRWRDPMDPSSSVPGVAITPHDQVIGTGDGTTRAFVLTKTYGALHAPYVRRITKPAAGVRIAVGGVERQENTDFTCDLSTGTVWFAEGHAPPAGATVSAGFTFDVPVRFDTDYLEINLSHFAAGDIPRIPIIEIRP
ncbi:glycoside hydrolase family 24 [Azorhizobium oxalatiphilum]|uniref:Glycoside hydrolase family 24 n=1 Tax=Azorhizobium oxalatiphilum TaxID=980631 RepID=A0A917BNN4_9HYPH|nr:DUF2460 domain-containing protein [Azorhizobium oxalatiphilum]GGF53218.1 glycoside hydrolase family 24 [Azorhizobium oxalatiphilum]